MLPDQTAPDLSNTLLQWNDEESCWTPAEGFHTDLLSSQPDEEHDLEGVFAIKTEEESVDWTEENVGCDPCAYMDVCAPVHVSTWVRSCSGETHSSA